MNGMRQSGDTWLLEMVAQFNKMRDLRIQSFERHNEFRFIHVDFYMSEDHQIIMPNK